MSFVDFRLFLKGSASCPVLGVFNQHLFVGKIAESLSNAKCSKPDVSRAKSELLGAEKQQGHGGMS